jgi:glycerol-3-phosphate dehydrogenase (NAD(P)+)
MAKIGILGAGGWGTALAMIVRWNGHEASLWARDADLLQRLAVEKRNEKYLPGVVLPDGLQFSPSMAEAFSGANFLVVAAPSHVLRPLLNALPVNLLAEDCIIISAVKGIENESFLRMSEVISQSLDGRFPVVALSGPSHAEEVSRKIPTAIVAACASLEVAKRAQAVLMGPTFRVYTHNDIVGVELGGALKNIIALAAGIGDGAGFGDNTKAALITRGLVEITRLGQKMGADPITFAGLSGMGDLVVTCMSRHSRNRFVGEQIGRGRTLDDVLAGMQMVAEGVRTTKAAYSLAQKVGVEMPITNEVYQVLFENKSPVAAVSDLMAREAKVERFG